MIFTFNTVKKYSKCYKYIIINFLYNLLREHSEGRNNKSEILKLKIV